MSDSTSTPVATGTAPAGPAETGTTTVALAAEGGAVMAADRRASVGGGRFVANKAVEKIEPVHPTAAVGMVGSVGGMSAFARALRAEASLYAARRGEHMSMDALSTLAGNLLRGGPYATGPTLAGVGAAPRIFDLDAAGGVLESAYVAKGSGMQVAYGVLEREYDPDLGPDGAAAVAARAVESATERDTASGNGIAVAAIDGDGIDLAGYDAAEEVA